MDTRAPQGFVPLAAAVRPSRWSKRGNGRHGPAKAPRAVEAVSQPSQKTGRAMNALPNEEDAAGPSARETRR
jgi:hypothetical protein